MSYSEKLKDPRWQQMRLKIMERDGFACRKCASKDKTLHVHHSYYTKGAEPWEYEPTALITLCEGCHKDVEDGLAIARVHLSQLLVSPCCSTTVAIEIMRSIGTCECYSASVGENFLSAESFLLRCSDLSSFSRGFRAGKKQAIADIKADQERKPQ
jgi:hypothetical protein